MTPYNLSHKLSQSSLTLLSSRHLPLRRPICTYPLYTKFSRSLLISEISRGSVVVQHTRGLNTCAVIRCYSTPCQSRSEEVGGSIPSHGAYFFFLLFAQALVLVSSSLSSSSQVRALSIFFAYYSSQQQYFWTSPIHCDKSARVDGHFRR